MPDLEGQLLEGRRHAHQVQRHHGRLHLPLERLGRLGLPLDHQKIAVAVRHLVLQGVDRVDAWAQGHLTCRGMGMRSVT